MQFLITRKPDAINQAADIMCSPGIIMCEPATTAIAPKTDYSASSILQLCCS